MDSMISIALKYSEAFAPSEGTIMAHQSVLEKLGVVWYGKLSSPVSDSVIDEIMKNDDPSIILINVKAKQFYVVHIDKIIKELPPLNEIPSYYRDRAESFHTWFKVKSFEKKDSSLLDRWLVKSSQTRLSNVYKKSMSPYFVIESVA